MRVVIVISNLFLWMLLLCSSCTSSAIPTLQETMSFPIQLLRGTPKSLSGSSFRWPLLDDKFKTSLELQLEEIGLVDIETLTDDIPVSLMYARDDNFTGKVMYNDLHKAYLHPEAAQALLKAQAELKSLRPDLSIKIYDAARPMSVQQIMWNQVKGTVNQIYVSNPKNGGGLHNYGLAVDVTLCNATTGDTLSMGTHIDYFGKAAQVRYEKACLEDGLLSKEAYENRLLLRKVMTSAGYKVLPTEWWHFNFKSRNEAKTSYTVIP